MSITEDYCSYEVAKLLKEKGFNEPCDNYYDKESCSKEQEPQELTCDEILYLHDKFIKAPTHQMAMKWLREVHSIAIEPMLLSWGWFCQIEKIIRDFCKEYIDETDSYKTYEDAVEAALKYCLENLI